MYSLHRLKEFSETASSKLSIEEFENVDLGEEEDPPAFKALKVKSKTKEVGDLGEGIRSIFIAFDKRIQRKRKNNSFMILFRTIN